MQTVYHHSNAMKHATYQSFRVMSCRPMVGMLTIDLKLTVEDRR